jgi:N-acetylglucosamine kinase-like BadF-type ATPase
VTILAVDGGNSKTDVALVAEDGRLLAAVRGPTTSHQQVGMDAGMEVLDGLVGEIRHQAGITAATPADVAVYGLAGADTPADTRRLTRALAARRFALANRVLNDAYTPIRIATDRGWGVALICGSGVNAAGIAPDGRTARLAALGDISGDWGGGTDIGKAALGAAIRARDRRGPRTSLERSVPAAFGMRRPIDLTRAIEAGRIHEHRLGELSPLVFDAAGAGDAVARAILDRQADELVAMGGAILRQLGLTRLDPDVVLAGGVFNARDAAFEARINAGLSAVASQARVRHSPGPPVLGAALLALDRVMTPGSPGRAEADATLRAALEAWRPR